MGFVEPGNVVDQSHPPHLGPYRFKNPWCEIIFFTRRPEIRNELALDVFQLDEDRQENLLLVPAPGNSKVASSSKSLIRAILLQLN
jgi:hypothetical protein